MIVLCYVDVVLGRGFELRFVSVISLGVSVRIDVGAFHKVASRDKIR